MPLTLSTKMKKLLTRSISGLIFVAIVIGSILWDEKAVLLIFAAISGLGLYEFHRLFQSEEILKFSPLVFTLAGSICFISLIYPIYSLEQSIEQGLIESSIFILIILFLFIIYQLWLDRSSLVVNLWLLLFGLCYVVIPLYIGALINLLDENDFPVLLGIFILVWTNDTFAYLSGNLFGKNKLIERISPNKTWEGFIGGFGVTVVVGFLLDKQLFNGDSFWLWAAIIVSPAAVLGDLFESLLKRKNSVKDTGSIMPGHGGILDRFDAMFFAIPFFYLWYIINTYLESLPS